MKTVLIVTHRHGFEADPVIDVLRSRGVPVFRFNCDSGQEAAPISLLIAGGDTEVCFECDGRIISSNEIGIGWCQQLPPYLGQPASISQCLQNENLWAAHFAALNLLDLPWLNRPSSVVRASNKIVQLILARFVGLNVPITLVSNAPDKIRTFVGSRSTVAKNLATPWIESGKETYAAYTRLVTASWLADDGELRFCPVIYQAHHRRRKDYRIVVVGEQTFAAACVPSKEQREDVRRNVGTGESFKACTFSPGAVRGLRSLMKELFIEYCAADFMEDDEGNLYFLDLNVCGAWWWVDRLYGGAICRTIAEYLETHL